MHLQLLLNAFKKAGGRSDGEGTADGQGGQGRRHRRRVRRDGGRCRVRRLQRGVGAGRGRGSGSSEAKSGPPDKDEVAETSEKFFAAWEKGDATTAASYTNNASIAGTLLTAYGEDAHIGGVEITPGTAAGTSVPFTVKAKVSYEGTTKPLSYRSTLTVVRGETSGRALVDWKPSVVHPDLKDGDTLVTTESATPQIQAVGRDGTVLTKEKYPRSGRSSPRCGSGTVRRRAALPASSWRSGTRWRARRTPRC